MASLGLSSLTPVVTAAGALSNLILVTPQSTVGYQPQNPPQNQLYADQPVSGLYPAFVFDYEGEQTATVESDITDHFVEDNTAIQDQIALKPVTITTHGFVSELNDIAPSLLAPLQSAAQKLQTISAYTPSLSITAILAYNTAFQIYQTTINAQNAAVAAWSTANGVALGGSSVINGLNVVSSTSPNQTKQQLAFQKFYGYWSQRTLFTIQTPWAIFTNMAIRSLRAIQDDSTRMVSDFEMQFKQIRFATTANQPNSNSVQSRLIAQSSTQTSIGTSAGTPGPGSNATATEAFPSLAVA